jgi:hypothetical protein
MGSPTLQTLQDPILLLPWVCFRGGGFPNPDTPSNMERCSDGVGDQGAEEALWGIEKSEN